MSRASDDQMDSLHGIVAAAYIEQIKAALAAGDGIPPALLTSASKYLKDNGVDRPVRPGDTLDTLAGLLPDLDSVIQFPGSK